MSDIKVALIGAGNIANAHLESYCRAKGAEVYAICDINPVRLQETADRFGISRRYTDVDTMLRELPELDAADVCVWNCNHAECSIKALETGLHVLCEKPMAYTAEEAVLMKQTADRMGKLLMIGFVLRFSDEAAIAKDFIDHGYLGEIYYTQAQYVRRHGNPGGWFCNKALSGGGPVIDLGVHVIDLVRYLAGNPDPVSVYAVTCNKLGKRDSLKTAVEWSPKDASPSDPCDVEDFASALIRYSNGMVTHLETAYSLNGEDSAKKVIYGTKAGIDLTSGIRLFTEYNDFLADVNVHTNNYKQSVNPFDAEIQHFVQCISQGLPCRAKAEDGIAVMKILDAIYESARTGHEVLIR